ncbi:hypothetical protein PQQ96_33890 [Paraburkholderia sediminicola]|uniref:hypothetical protein n=1 Tax=Paraburkholderia sediminicola TaxID=458836 RepID=UPI0038B77232
MLIYGEIASSIAIVLGLASISDTIKFHRAFSLIGDASYSIYLSHIVISLRIAEAIYRHAPITGWWQFIGWIFTSLSISLAIGVTAYLLIEKPALRWIKKTGISVTHFSRGNST